MNPESSKTSNPKKLLLTLPHINLKSRDKYAALSNLNIYYRWKNIKKSYRNNELKISTPTQNNKLELPDESYFVMDIQYSFQYIIKEHEIDNFPIRMIIDRTIKTDNSPVRIYINKTAKMNYI